MRNFELDLKRLRQEALSFEEAIFSASRDILHHHFQLVEQEAAEPKEVGNVAIKKTELGQVISSMEQFAQKKSALSTDIPTIDSVKIDQYYQLEQCYSYSDCLSYFATRTNLTKDLQALKMICLVSSSDPTHSDLASFSRSEAGNLFLKMVDSFKLDPKSVGVILHAPAIHQIDFEKSYEGLAKQEFESILSTILLLKPNFVVSFGGLSSNFLRQKKDNLATVHGKFNCIKVTYGTSSHIIEHFPLFHPSLLLANPSSKKIAWEDMKQLINKL